MKRDPEGRALARLARGAVLVPETPRGPGDEPVRYRLHRGEDARTAPLMRVAHPTVDALTKAGAIRFDADGRGRVTEEGLARAARRAADPEEAFAVQHAPREDRPALSPDGAVARVRAVMGQTPLERLARASGDSSAFLSPREAAAGARLKQDHERSTLHARVTSAWNPVRCDRTRPGPSHGVLDGPDAALAARERVADAYGALGVGLDVAARAVCVEETPLEALERRQNWPRRSAKVVLKIALARLADHYGLPPDPLS